MQKHHLVGKVMIYPLILLTAFIINTTAVAGTVFAEPAFAEASFSEPTFAVPSFSEPAFAAASFVGATVAEAVPQNQGISVLVNNYRITFDQPPVNMNGRVMVPIRHVAEHMGYSVFWDDATQTVYINTPDVPLEMTAVRTNHINVYVNNERTIFTDQPPVSMGGRVLIPVRFVTEKLGYDVRWEGDTQTVRITSLITVGSTYGIVTIHFIDVGQGDAIFIDYGEFEILIDGGDPTQGRVIAEYIREFVDGPIDFVIATHPHGDHIGGLPYIIRNFDIGTIIYNGQRPDSGYFRDFHFATLINDRADRIVVHDAIIRIGSLAEFHIFAPMSNYERENDNSIVAMLLYNEISVLFTGDIEAAAERDLMYRLPAVNVLNVAHHGSRTSSNVEFLESIRPDYAIISAGRYNPFGHPHREAMERLLASGATIYGTFIDGTIIMTIDWNGYSISATTPLTLNNIGRTL